MEQRNSYFQMDIRQNGSYIRIFPPKEGGQPIVISELVEYLNNCGCKSYDLKELNQILGSDKEAELRVGESDGIPINEIMKLDVMADEMSVVCRFYPPSAGGSRMDIQEIIKDLQYRGIRAGIDQEQILLFLKEHLYCTDYIMAKGQTPQAGHDAKITYYFPTDVTLKPKRNGDGSVDYRELGTISHVKAGDLLASLTPEDNGKPGWNVFGQEIKPPSVKKQKLSFAHNITLSEDGTKIYSDITGHASLVDNKVFVSDVYEVPADVDNSIGNIDYQGNVYVKGNVKGGFRIVAQGDIVVEGVVEDANLRAGGHIIVKRGIHGMTKGILQADGNIICKFIENATVISGGFIEADAILHSQVSAATEIRVSGKKGFITGGVIRAGALVEATTIGSEMGAVTRIEVGMDPAKKERYNEVQKTMQQVNRELDQMKPILMTYSQKLAAGDVLAKDKLQYVQQLARVVQTKQQELTDLQEEYERLHLEITQSSNARVKVKNSIYSGVTVGISDVSITLREERSFCQLLKRQGDVVIDTL